jgi:hypothetical protein
VRATSRENEFGLFDNTKETITPVAQSVTHDSEARADQTVETVWEKNADAKADATAVSGKIVRATSRENEFGLFDNTKETITPVDQDTGWEEFPTEYGTSYTRRWTNQAAGFGEATVAADMAATTSNSFGVNLNMFGLEDGSASRIARKDDSASDAVTVSWVKRDLYYDRVKDEADGTTKTQRVTFEEHVKYEGTRASAESEAGSKCTTLGNVRDVNISRIQLATGRTKYRVVLLTAPTAYGAWGT